MRSGDIYLLTSGTFGVAGQRYYAWSSRTYSTKDYAYDLRIDSTTIQPSHYLESRQGLPLRCLSTVLDIWSGGDDIIKEMDNFLFIDDSGSKHWDVPYSRDFVDNPPARTNSNRQFWQQNYFVLAGIHISRDVMAVLNPLIDEKKKEVFGTKHVELHSTDLRVKMKRKYLDPYGINKEQLVEFIDGFWYPLFDKYDMQLVAVIVDKRYYKNPRHENKTPLEIAVEALFDRTELHPHRDCQIVFDQMDSQIKSHKRDQGKVLQIADTKINLQDGKYKNKYSHTSVRFEKSASSNFLQLADMVAYNVWRQFVDFGDEWDNHSAFGEHRVLPTYTYFERISNRFYHNDDDKVNGYGIVKLPDPFNNLMKGWYIKKPPIDK